MSLNFAEFKIADSANTRKTGVSYKRGQNFKHLRFRKFIMDKGKETEREETIFQLSDAMFVETGLNSSDLAATFIAAPNNGPVGLAVVKRDDGIFLKHSDKAQERNWEKGSKFKSTKLEDDLLANGVLTTPEVGKSQNLSLELAGENVTLADGTVALRIYVIGKDDSVVIEDEESTSEVLQNASVTNEETAERQTDYFESADEDEF